MARTHSPEVQPTVGDSVWAILPPFGGGTKLEQMRAWTGPWEVLAFDAVTSKVDLAYRSDADVRIEASVHVRNTLPFSATRPLDPPHLLDETVFGKDWEKSSMPLGWHGCAAEEGARGARQGAR